MCESTRSDQAERGKERGFTLLELIIVVVFITLILGLSTVFFANTLPSAKLNSLSREVSSTIRYARVLARNRGERQAIVVDLDARTFGMEGGVARPVPPEISMRIVDPFAGDIYTGKYSFVFYGTGGMEGGTIFLSHRKRIVSIALDPVAGTVMVKR
ncbi:MAG: hypothetical protein A4E63_03383 [Syntrophorhabdus sp. PtaU1.Bin050]|nr:MAG: hypothetical protein A4E63_03383 [Syntrophorhabdus sp. PtaU1.Bin050]